MFTCGVSDIEFGLDEFLIHCKTCLTPDLISIGCRMAIDPSRSFRKNGNHTTPRSFVIWPTWVKIDPLYSLVLSAV